MTSAGADLMRVYAADELGSDGYPFAWHGTTEVRVDARVGIKHLVRDQAGHRCIRCGHPYTNGQHGNGEWSPCDEECEHGGPIHVRGRGEFAWMDYDGDTRAGWFAGGDIPLQVEARWRILTVHHLNGDKADCRWWNLVALCQRCHLTIQGKVDLQRVWPWEHSDWFKPYAAAWYAHTYLGEDLSRVEVEARIEELLALERLA